MSWRTILIIVLASLGLWQGYDNWRLRRLTPRARYDITARILGREDYHVDRLSDLVPEDRALGWGPMSDNRVLRAFEITQAARFYSWVPREALPIPRREVIEHSANTHVIPADAGVRRRLERLRIGQVVHLSGFLVNAVRDDGAYLNTSLTRSDSGPGSCEVLLVEQLEAW
ncbi:MAG TPA: hypothetical protein VEG26_02160 [Steroidobacteraceae bacterium]|nr:hypothetical protein [Steroidobacteraceae bacterium]